MQKTTKTQDFDFKKKIALYFLLHLFTQGQIIQALPFAPDKILCKIIHMKTAMLLSGGVDSSVALQLLKNSGHQIEAFYIKIWLEDELVSSTCPWEEDLSFVEKVCNKVNVPLHIISMQKEYRDKIIAYTVEQAKAGRTPNPDVMCNQQIKFGAFFDKIGPEFSKVATGHYAQIIEENGKFKLMRSQDSIKDQTYFLCQLSQNQLSRALFPIGHLTKKEVRELAKKFELPTKDRAESQGLCFLGKIKFNDFIAHHVGTREGEIIEFETGKKLGTHNGVWYFTIGQRQGIKLSAGPWYVVAKDALNNQIFVSNKYDFIEKERNSFYTGLPHMLSEDTYNELLNAQNLFVKVRHKTEPKPCKIKQVSQDKFEVILASKDQGIASGQFACFYDCNTCLGSSVIF